MVISYLKELMQVIDKVMNFIWILCHEIVAIENVDKEFSQLRSMKDVTLSRNDDELEAAINIVNQLEQEVIKKYGLIFERFLGDPSSVREKYTTFLHWKEIRDEVIRLVKDGRGITNVKQGKEAGEVINRYAEDLSNATSKIEEYEIPKYESQLTFLLTHKLVGLEDDLTIQLIGSIEIYKKILEVMYKNFEVLENLSGKEMIRVGNHITLEEITNDIDIRFKTQ